jgi:hypothetical protein
MYRVIQGTTNNLPDEEEFIGLLNTMDQHSDPELRSLFDPEQMIVVTRAPGRLDVMGGIADYSGSLVLELPIREATFVALQRDPGLAIRVVSLSYDTNQDLSFDMSLNDFLSAGGAIEYDVARAHFQQDPERRWASYVVGVFLVLMRERGLSFSHGARILISSRVPVGKGVSSSAALEVAVMQAVAAAFDLEIGPRELAILCQKVENLIVGAPCGIMDQMTSVCGEANRLLALLCQPAEIQGMIPIPSNIAFWGIDSGIRHSVAAADYGSVRAAAFMGYRIIAELAGLVINKDESGEPCEIDDPRWGGYLANLSIAELRTIMSIDCQSGFRAQSFWPTSKAFPIELRELIPSRSMQFAPPPPIQFMNTNACASLLSYLLIAPLGARRSQRNILRRLKTQRALLIFSLLVRVRGVHTEGRP